jgi:uncharacterized BrkB/YihY/UPF0761 family membrane protein
VAALKNLPHIPGVPNFVYSDFGTILPVIVGVLAGFLLFLTIYYVIPNRKQQFRKVLPGAILSAVLFELITLLFPLYIALNKGINQYGQTFALFFLLMAFFFFMGLIIMIGVELNSVIYPIGVQQPIRGETLTAAPKTAEDAEGRRPPRRKVSHNGQRGPVRTGIKARTAVLVAVAASVVGVLLGRRSANS